MSPPCHTCTIDQYVVQDRPPDTHSVPINTLNRQCSSGLTAIAQIANEIKSGEIDIGLAAGVEHMTAHYGAGVLPERMSDDVLANPESADCLIPMGITSENVAKQYKISRDVQDTFAANSFAKASEAQKAGKFREEIVPVKVCSLIHSRLLPTAQVERHALSLTIRSAGQTPRPKRKRKSSSMPMTGSELA